MSIPAPASGGTFHLRYTFPAGGEFRLFADVAPKGAGSQILMAKVNVAGANRPEARRRRSPIARSSF